MADLLSHNEQMILLTIARQAIQAVTVGDSPNTLDLSELPPAFREIGASFVTITRAGQLRGCIGAIEAYQPLVFDVQEHAMAAATEDYRFPPVTFEELPYIIIEISRLTPPVKMDYDDSNDLLEKLRPGVDGVVLRNGIRRATFLPQVWEKVARKEDFLDHLCIKMGAQPGLWREKPLEVFTYQVEEFREEHKK
ncbi:MAG: AmmeMemoRadiSam system protein A [Chloroflexi bacterium]|nr:AmmeMemoRadiSam system protein A [Chloroflexota bacterium]